VADYDLKKRLGDGIRQVRDTLGWSQAQVAKKANIKTQTFGKIERGQENACLTTIEGLCRALDLDLPLLLTPLKTSDSADRMVLVAERHLKELRDALDAINPTPSSRRVSYPPIKRRRRKPTKG
jgi:transcriptional regulator with XRE-family HTH domain